MRRCFLQQIHKYLTRVEKFPTRLNPPCPPNQIFQPLGLGARRPTSNRRKPAWHQCLAPSCTHVSLPHLNINWGALIGGKRPNIHAGCHWRSRRLWLGSCNSIQGAGAGSLRSPLGPPYKVNVESITGKGCEVGGFLLYCLRVMQWLGEHVHVQNWDHISR